MAQILPNVSGNRLSHAYLISSEAPEERNALAVQLAMAMLCDGADKPCGVCRHCRKVRDGIHPDLSVLSRETGENSKGKKEIYVDRIRDLIADVAVCPNEAERKVYVIHDTDTMNSSAQNAMLKVLEEPPAHACFILCAEKASGMLGTIRSRCVELTINAEADALPAAALKLADAYLEAAASGSRAELLRFCFAQEGLDGEQAEQFAQAAKQRLADMLCGRCDSRGLSRKALMHLTGLMETVQEYLRFHVGVKHIFGLLAVRTLTF